MLKGLGTKIETLKEGVKLSVLFSKEMGGQVFELQDKELSISTEPVETLTEGLAEAKELLQKAINILSVVEGQNKIELKDDPMGEKLSGFFEELGCEIVNCGVADNS